MDKIAKRYENFTVLLTYKIHHMQRLQQAGVIFLRNSVANYQMLVPLHACLHSLHPSIQGTTKG
jgi:hypothetical protein